MITFKEYLAEIAIKGKAVKSDKIDDLINKARSYNISVIDRINDYKDLDEFRQDVSMWIDYVSDNPEEFEDDYESEKDLNDAIKTMEDIESNISDVYIRLKETK